MYTNKLYLTQKNTNVYNIRTLVLGGTYQVLSDDGCIIYNQIKVPNQNEHANISDINLINTPEPLRFKIKCDNYNNISYRVINLDGLCIELIGDILR